MPGQLSVNAPHVVHETIDGETILIHLGTGTYYSLEGVGAEVWALAISGVTAAHVVEEMTARHKADPQLVQRSVGALVDELLAEGLLTLDGAVDADASGTADGAAAPAFACNGSQTGQESRLAADGARAVGESEAGATFAVPVLHKYTDMQEFMLVDPLHDVEADAGWPHVKAG